MQLKQWVADGFILAGGLPRPALSATQIGTWHSQAPLPIDFAPSFLLLVLPAFPLPFPL